MPPQRQSKQSKAASTPKQRQKKLTRLTTEKEDADYDPVTPEIPLAVQKPRSQIYQNNSAQLRQRKFFIGNLNLTEVKEEELLCLFNTLGTVVEVKGVMTDQDGHNIGYGYTRVAFQNPVPWDAVKRVNGIMLHGKALAVFLTLADMLNHQKLCKEKFIRDNDPALRATGGHPTH